jgi:hypothetical protein
MGPTLVHERELMRRETKRAIAPLRLEMAQLRAEFEATRALVFELFRGAAKAEK